MEKADRLKKKTIIITMESYGHTIHNAIKYAVLKGEGFFRGGFFFFFFFLIQNAEKIRKHVTKRPR